MSCLWYSVSLFVSDTWWPCSIWPLSSRTRKSDTLLPSTTFRSWPKVRFFSVCTEMRRFGSGWGAVTDWSVCFFLSAFQFSKLWETTVTRCPVSWQTIFSKVSMLYVHVCISVHYKTLGEITLWRFEPSVPLVSPAKTLDLSFTSVFILPCFLSLLLVFYGALTYC